MWDEIEFLALSCFFSIMRHPKRSCCLEKLQVFFKMNLKTLLHIPDLMIEMEDQTNDISEAGIPVLDYKTYTDRVFFLPSKDGEKDVMITGKLDIPEARRQTVEQSLNQFSNLLNSKSFLINVSTKVDSPCLLTRYTCLCKHNWAENY